MRTSSTCFFAALEKQCTIPSETWSNDTRNHWMRWWAFAKGDADGGCTETDGCIGCIPSFLVELMPKIAKGFCWNAPTVEFEFMGLSKSPNMGSWYQNIPNLSIKWLIILIGTLILYPSAIKHGWLGNLQNHRISLKAWHEPTYVRTKGILRKIGHAVFFWFP